MSRSQPAAHAARHRVRTMLAASPHVALRRAGRTPERPDHDQVVAELSFGTVLLVFGDRVDDGAMVSGSQQLQYALVGSPGLRRIDVVEAG